MAVPCDICRILALFSNGALERASATLRLALYSIKRSLLSFSTSD